MHTSHQTASARGESAILHSALVRKASRNSVQDDGLFFWSPHLCIAALSRSFTSQADRGNSRHFSPGVRAFRFSK